MAFTVEINQESSYPSIILKDVSTGCFAEIYALGALLNAFHIPTKQSSVNIIDGFANVEEAAALLTKHQPHFILADILLDNEISQMGDLFVQTLILLLVCLCKNKLTPNSTSK